MHGTRNDYRLVEQDDYLLVDGLHEGIVSEELWHEAQVKLLAQAEKYEHVNRGNEIAEDWLVRNMLEEINGSISDEERI